ncbi:MAG: transglycosylase SLT domain-containing protein [Magnetococcales bacterium]|nr:transglycosylase SLT domain-containing protein [Magnetococcales bacterium]
MLRYLIIIAILLCNPAWVASVEADSTMSGATGRLIQKVAKQERVDPYLLQAIITVESAFNSKSVSNKGAVGLMQLMPATARELGVTNRFNPEQNIRGGARYLKRMLSRFPNVRLALAAYNAGPANVTRFRGIPPFKETRKYVGNVMLNYSKINPGSGAAPKRMKQKQKPNGTLILTDTRRIFTTSLAANDLNGVQLSDKRSEYLSIRRGFSHRLSILPASSPVATNVPVLVPKSNKELDSAKVQPQTNSPIVRAKVSLKSSGKTVSVVTNRPVIQLASLEPADLDSAIKIERIKDPTAITSELNHIPVYRLSHQ